jgi:5-methylthioadenosine/S-adenosylhomocysteine deaminase
MTTVIFNAKVQPTSDPKSYIERGGLVIDGNKITQLFSGYWTGSKEGVTLFDAQGKLIIPGLVNGHTHLAMTLFKGVAENLDLMTWLYQYIFPLESKWVKKEVVALGTRLALLECIRSGVTTISDMYYFTTEVASAVADAGIRGWVGQAMMGIPCPDSKDISGNFKNVEILCDQFSNHPLVTPVAAPHSTYLDDLKTLKKISDFIRERNLFTHIHVAETQSELKLVAEKQKGMSPVEVLEETGFSNLPMAWAHAIWFSEEDYKRIKNFKHVGMIHNPECNMKLASGVSPLHRFKEMNIPFGLGTDGSASNNNLDLLSELDTAVKLQRVHLNDPTTFPTHEAFHAVTQGGATVLQAETQIGSLEVGKKADLALIDLDQPHLQPCPDVLAMLVFCARAGDVSDLMVDGNWVMRNRVIETLNEFEILEEAKALGKEIHKSIAK